VLVTRYMNETGQTTPEIQLKAEGLISAGYQLLLTYEHDGGGFSWFGEPGDPYLTVTALGVMEFSDMAEVYPIDPALLPRTVDWLVGKQQADGSWLGDISEFFSFQSSTLRNTAFVVWALATSGYTGAALDKGVAYVAAELSLTDTDAYTLATAANALAMAAPQHPKAQAVLDKLDAMKKADGDFYYWDSDGTQTSFYGYGDSAAIETTALVTHALLQSGGYKATVDGAVAWLLSKKDANGNFGSTQSTIWTLRALIAAALNGGEGAVGELVVSLDGAPQATLPLLSSQWDVMQTVDLSTGATPGAHEVTLAFTGEGKVSYNLVASHHLPWDVAGPPEPGPVEVSVAYDKTTLEVNETVKSTVSVKNNTGAKLNMVLVTLGVPPGFVVESDDFASYIAQGVLQKVETTAKQTTLYIFEMEPLSTQVFEYRLRATMPVKASDGGATAYPYYEPEKKTESEPTTLEVTEG
jgi:hypothetical protein